MPTKRIFLRDLTDQHLLWLHKALEWSVEARLESWLKDWADGTLEVYEVTNGLAGIKRYQDYAFVLFIAGEGMKPFAKEIQDQIKELVAPLPLEAHVTREGLVRFYKNLGWSHVCTAMRLD
jgi:hypothetical protein